jgi:hypothetical protein
MDEREDHQTRRHCANLPHRGERGRPGGGSVGADQRCHSHRRVEPRVLPGRLAARGYPSSPGVRFHGRNRSGWLRWSRVCEVVAVEAPRELAWRTIPTPLLPDSTEWHIALEPVNSGTRIVQSYKVIKVPGWLHWVTARVNPAHIDRSGALADDLRRIGAIAAGDTSVKSTA